MNSGMARNVALVILPKVDVTRMETFEKPQNTIVKIREVLIRQKVIGNPRKMRTNRVTHIKSVTRPRSISYSLPLPLIHDTESGRSKTGKYPAKGTAPPRWGWRFARDRSPVPTG